VHRRSTIGYYFVLNGGVVAYRFKTQAANSSTTADAPLIREPGWSTGDELRAHRWSNHKRFLTTTAAEFLAATIASKTAKYLRVILHELGFPQSAPTPIYVDNISVIQIINARECTRHIEIQAFANQEWKDNGEILMHHIPGVINPSDSLTKPTSTSSTRPLALCCWFRRMTLDNLPDLGFGMSPLGIFTNSTFPDDSHLQKEFVSLGALSSFFDPKLQGTKKLPKWQKRSWQGIFLRFNIFLSISLSLLSSWSFHHK
jgi:hypothetical protein